MEENMNRHFIKEICKQLIRISVLLTIGKCQISPIKYLYLTPGMDKIKKE